MQTEKKSTVVEVNSLNIDSDLLHKRLEPLESTLLQLRSDLALRLSKEISRLIFLQGSPSACQVKQTLELSLARLEQNSYYLKEICSTFLQIIQQLEGFMPPLQKSGTFNQL